MKTWVKLWMLGWFITSGIDMSWAQDEIVSCLDINLTGVEEEIALDMRLACIRDLQDSLAIIEEAREEAELKAAMADQLTITVQTASNRLNMTPAEFMDSPAGMTATALLAWEYAAHDIWRWGVRVPFSLFLLFIGALLFRHMCTETLQAVEVTTIFGRKRTKVIRVPRKIKDWEDGEMWFIFIYGIIAVGYSMFVIWN